MQKIKVYNQDGDAGSQSIMFFAREIAELVDNEDDANIVETNFQCGVFDDKIRNYNGKKILICWTYEVPFKEQLSQYVCDAIDKLVQVGNDPKNIYFIYNNVNDIRDRYGGEEPYGVACHEYNIPIYDINILGVGSFELRTWENIKYHIDPDESRIELENFLSLNGKLKKFHRIVPILMMDYIGVYDNGKVSMIYPNEIDLEMYFQSHNSSHMYEQWLDDILELVGTREILDVDNSDAGDHYHGFPIDVSLYKNTFMSYVSETHFGNGVTDDVFFPTEKLFRSILNCHPFIVASTPKFLHNLRKFGYKTFSPYIDELYDADEDAMNRVYRSVVSLSSAISADLETKKRIYEICIYNQQHMLSRVKTEHKRIKEFLGIYE